MPGKNVPPVPPIVINPNPIGGVGVLPPVPPPAPFQPVGPPPPPPHAHMPDPLPPAPQSPVGGVNGNGPLPAPPAAPLNNQQVAQQAPLSLASELQFEANLRDETTDVRACVEKAAALKDPNTGKLAPFSLKWDLLTDLPNKPHSEYTGAELLQAKFAVSSFLAANSPAVFSKEVLSRISPAALFLGAEGSGKSSTVAGIIGRALTFTASEEARQDIVIANPVGTRCPTKLTIRRSTDTTLLSGDSVRLSGLSSVLDSTILSPQQASEHVAAHMESLRNRPPGISHDPITVSVEASKAPLPLICFDLPGMVNIGGKEGPEFAKASHDLTEQMVRQWIFNPSSTSRAFAVTSSKQQMKFNGYLHFLLDEADGHGRRNLSDRVTWVVTGIELMTDELKKRMLAIDSDDKLKGFLLRHLADTVKERTHGKQWPSTFFLVCNADMEERTGLTTEQRYAKVKENIAAEIAAEPDSRTGRFLQLLRDQRETYTQHMEPNAKAAADSAWKQWETEHIGLRALQSFVHEVSLKDATHELEFARNFLVACMQHVKKDLEAAQRLLDAVGPQADVNATLEDIVMSMKDLLYYIVLQKTIPADPNRRHTLPTDSETEDLMNTDLYATLLKEDAAGLIKFPDVLTAAEEDYLYGKVNPSNPGADRDDGRRAQIPERLKRFLTNFHIRIALCAPKKETERSLARHMGQAAVGMQATGLQGHLVTCVDRFVRDILDGQAKQYVEGGMARIMNSAVDLTIKLLQRQQRYKQYLIKDDTPTQFNKDLVRYAEKHFTGAVTSEVDKMCSAAAASISTPLLPQFPQHFRLTAVLLPRNSKFVRKFFTDRNDVREARALRDEWKTATLVKELVNGTLKTADGNDEEFSHWDWLDKPESRKVLVDVVNEVMREQSASDTLLGHTAYNNTATQEDADAFNHCLLLHTRAIIVQYSFQMRVLLPKTYLSLQEDSFLTSTAIKDNFLKFIQTETEEQKMDKKLRDILVAAEIPLKTTLVMQAANGGPSMATPLPTRPSTPLPLSPTLSPSETTSGIKSTSYLNNRAEGVNGIQSSDSTQPVVPPAPVTLATFYKDEVAIDPRVEHQNQLNAHAITIAPLTLHAGAMIGLVEAVGGTVGAQKLLDAINHETRA